MAYVWLSEHRHVTDLPKREPRDVFTEQLPVIDPVDRYQVGDAPAAGQHALSGRAPGALFIPAAEQTVLEQRSGWAWFEPALPPVAQEYGWAGPPDADVLLDAAKVLTDHGRMAAAVWVADWAEVRS